MFKTKPELGVELVERAAGWDVPKAPVLGDQAYGENTDLRGRLHDAGLRVRAGGRRRNEGVRARDDVRRPQAQRAARPAADAADPPDRDAQAIGELIADLDPGDCADASRSATAPTASR